MTTVRYIECIGLPGSGKTESAALLHARLAENGIHSSVRSPLHPNIFLRFKLVCDMIATLVRMPILVRLWFSPIRTEYRNTRHVRSVVRMIHLRVLSEIVVAKYLCARESGLVINDEGVIGKLVVLAILTGLTEDTIVKVLHSALPKDCGLIYVSAPSDVAIARVALRANRLPFFDEMESELKHQFYSRNHAFYKKVCEQLQQSSRSTVFYVENAGSKDLLTETMHRVVSQIA